MTCVARGCGMVLATWNYTKIYSLASNGILTRIRKVKFLAIWIDHDPILRNLFSAKNLRNLILIIVIVGVLVLAISGYLTPIFSVSVSR